MKVINIAFEAPLQLRFRQGKFQKKLRFNPSGEEEVESLTGELR